MECYLRMANLDLIEFMHPAQLCCSCRWLIFDFDKLWNCTNRFFAIAKICQASYKSEEILSNLRLSEFRRHLNLNMDLSPLQPALDSARLMKMHWKADLINFWDGASIGWSSRAKNISPKPRHICPQMNFLMDKSLSLSEFWAFTALAKPNWKRWNLIWARVCCIWQD